MLSDLDEDCTVETCRKMLEQAHGVLPEYARPLIDLGHWHYAYEEDNARALKTFVEAQRHAEKALVDSYAGQIKALCDLGDIDKAKRLYTRLVRYAEMDAEPDDDSSRVDSLIYSVRLDNPDLIE
jgi:hypothetical protein